MRRVYDEGKIYGASDKSRGKEAEKRFYLSWNACIFPMYLTSRSIQSPFGVGGICCIHIFLSFCDCHDGGAGQGCPFFSGGQKKFPDTYYRPENFFALTRAPGMAHNAHDESPLWETGRGGLGEREWYPYRNYRERYRNRKNENHTHCNREISNTRQRQEPESKNENRTHRNRQIHSQVLTNLYIRMQRRKSIWHT